MDHCHYHCARQLVPSRVPAPLLHVAHGNLRHLGNAQMPDYSSPVILRGMAEPSVEEFCKKIHRTLITDFKCAHRPHVSVALSLSYSLGLSNAALTRLLRWQ